MHLQTTKALLRAHSMCVCMCVHPVYGINECFTDLDEAVDEFVKSFPLPDGKSQECVREK